MKTRTDTLFPSRRSSDLKKDNTIYDLAERNLIMNVSAVFRRDLFGPLPEWFNVVSTYDYAIHMINAAHGKLYFMNKPMAVYRNRDKAIWSTSSDDKKWIIAIKVRELLLGYFEENYLNKSNNSQNQNTSFDISIDYQRVYDILLNTTTNIYLSLLSFYKNNNNIDKFSDYSNNLIKLHTDWDINIIEEKIQQKNSLSAPSKRSKASGFLTNIRKELSKFYTIPQIK